MVSSGLTLNMSTSCNFATHVGLLSMMTSKKHQRWIRMKMVRTRGVGPWIQG